MKRRTGVLVVLALVALVALVLMMTAPKKESKPQVKAHPSTSNPTLDIAAIFDLSGSLSYMGQWSFEGAKIAEDQLNEQGGVEVATATGKMKRRVRLVIEDGGTNPSKTKAAYERLEDQGTYPVIMGFNQSGEVTAMAPVMESDGVALLSTGAASPGISAIGGKMVFRNRLSNEIETKALASLAYGELKARRVLMVTMNTDYGIGFSDAFSKNFEGNQGKIVGNVRFEQGQSDFAPTVVEIDRVSGYDTLCIAGNGREGARLIKALAQNKVKVQHLIGANALDAPELPDIAGTAADGMIIAVAKFDPSAPAAREFSRRYREVYGHEPEMFAANAYDGVRLLASVYSQGASSGNDFGRILSSGASFPGVSGVTRFDEHGDVQREVCLKRFNNGKFSIIPVSP